MRLTLVCKGTPNFILFLVPICVGLAWASTARAAPPVPETDLNSPRQEAHPPEETSERKLETLDIATPPPKKSVKKQDTTDIFFPYQNSISPRVGVGTSNLRPSDKPYYYFLGVNYMMDSPTNRHLEIGVDLTSEPYGIFHLAHKWVFTQGSAFRPFAKIGPSVRLYPDEQLGTFLKPQNYQLRLGVGFEKLLRAPMSLRVGLEGAWTSGGYEAAVALGYSWAW